MILISQYLLGLQMHSLETAVEVITAVDNNDSTLKENIGINYIIHIIE